MRNGGILSIILTIKMHSGLAHLIDFIMQRKTGEKQIKILLCGEDLSK